MKKVLIKFDIKKAGEIADIIGTNGFVTLLSWSESSGMFDVVMKAYIAYPSEKEDAVLARFGQLIQKS